MDNFYWVYDPVSSNCEKFAIWCRYRVDEWGRQGELVRNVAVTSLAVVGAAAVGVIGAACLGFKAVDTALNCGKKKRGESRQQQQITAEDSANDEHNQEDDVVELDDI